MSTHNPQLMNPCSDASRLSAALEIYRDVYGGTITATELPYAVSWIAAETACDAAALRAEIVLTVQP